MPASTSQRRTKPKVRRNSDVISKKRSCIKCKIELASDNKLPFCPACWEEITGYLKKTGIAMGTLMVALIRKYGPKVGKAVFMAIKATLKK